MFDERRVGGRQSALAVGHQRYGFDANFGEIIQQGFGVVNGNVGASLTFLKYSKAAPTSRLTRPRQGHVHADGGDSLARFPCFYPLIVPGQLRLVESELRSGVSGHHHSLV